MSEKHTPGPWMYHATAGNHDFEVYPESTGRTVALVRDFHEGNARLIAAAPELLDAVQVAYDYMEAIAKGETWPDGMYRDAGEWVREIGALLARVQGEG